VDDVAALIAHNEHFIESWRRGSWECLREILGRDFGYLDGRTGEMWDQNRYVADLRATPVPTLVIDEVVMHVAGNIAAVSARTHSDNRPHRPNRYLDTYEHRDGRWQCVHACVWPRPAPGDATVTP
jgi:uncharacterized protein DUF4440